MIARVKKINQLSSIWQFIISAIYNQYWWIETGEP